MHENDTPVILVVDDTDAMRYASSKILKAAGFNVIGAETGYKALELAKQNPDLIVLDIDLPDINGFEVCKLLKADPATKSIPILHLTAVYQKLYDKVAGLEGGADGYLSHPVESIELVATVNALLRLKRAEAEAVDKTYEWQATFDSVKDIIWILDTEYRIQQTNKAVEGIFQYSSKEIIGKHCWEIVHGTKEPIPGCPFPRMLKSLQRETLDLQTGERWFEVTVDPIVNKDNQYAGAIHVFSDITERKRTEEVLRQRTEELETVLDAIPAFVWIGLDPDCSVVKGNRAASDMTGTLTEDNVSQSAAKFGHAVYIKQLKEDGSEYQVEELPMKRAIALGKPVHDVFINFQFPDGRQISTLGHAVPLFDEQNQPRGAVAAFLDITEYLNMQAQLRQSQKMEAVGRLAGGVAHDFNNMLSIINGFSELALLQLAPSDPVYRNIQEIKEAGDRSADLIRQLLAFARKQTVAPEVLDMNQFIGNSEKMLKRLIGEDISLKIIKEPELYLVKIDPSQMNQILFNLAVNSRDAISGVGSITIETANVTLDADFCQKHPDSTQGQFALLSFRDSGYGIDKETQSKIFEPFFTTKSEDKGTGLGLATIYGIVKQNSGFIDLYSKPGKGTVFKIYLPRFEGEPTLQIKTLDAQPLTGTETILVVEDEEQILSLCQEVLESNGYSVITAGTPEEAILLSKKTPFKIHLLLTDIVMPSMNGKDLYERIKAFRPEIQVLYMSGYTYDVIAHRGVLAEGAHFVQKPFTLDGLVGKVREVLDSHFCSKQNEDNLLDDTIND
ncbi:MAG: response regulator [Thermodesulfobacteriota bacterium]|nr:response regulator [Thermodesulfobacteriota bacterium]